MSVQNLKIDGFVYGVDLSDGTSGTSLTDVDITDSLVGIKKGTTAGVSNLTVTNGSISDGLMGIDFETDPTTVGAQAVGTADQVRSTVPTSATLPIRASTSKPCRTPI